MQEMLESLKNISKTDWWVIIGFWIMALPIVVSDYKSGMSLSNAYKLVSLDIILITATAIITVYYLAPKFLSTRKYVAFISSLFIILVLEGLLYYFGYGLIWTIKSPESWLEFMADEIVSGGQSLGMLGGILLAKKYFEGQQNMLKLESETKANELRALQSQVNPHFLFNNLNSLDELIDTNPQEAKNYVNKLAQLYRYLINSKDNDVVTLKEEMEFAKNYIYLLNQRYGDSYIFEILEENTDLENVLIPPASLQLLLENVVKHNIGSIEDPLITTIQLKESRVIISNQKRKKSQSQEIGTGLKNLVSRYFLLSDLPVEIKEEEDKFTICLPLLSLLK